MNSEDDDHDGMRLELPSGRSWDVVEKFLRTEFATDIMRLSADARLNAIILTGEVFSETAKNRIGRMIERLMALSVDNQVTVTSVFYPAQSELEQKSATALPTTSIARYPQIAAEASPVRNEPFVVTVDLTTEADELTEGVSITIENLRTKWRSLEVEVDIFCDELDLERADRRRSIHLYRNGTSKPAGFIAMPNEKAFIKGKVAVTAVFQYKGRNSGFAQRTFIVDMIDHSSDAVSLKKPGGDVSSPYINTIQIEPQAASPDLTVTIHQPDRADGRLQWAFSAPSLRYSTEVVTIPTTNLGPTPQDYFLEKFKECPTLRPTRHENKIRGIGDTIWDATPSEFKAVYNELRSNIGSSFPIQIWTDDPFVPWEFMFPDDSVFPDADHLFMTHPISRWTIGPRRMVPSFEAGQIASFVPRYNVGTLPSAKEEGEWLVNELSAVAMEPSYDGFTSCLQKPPENPIQILHFAGHGASETAEAGSRGLRMSDEWIGVDELNRSVKLGDRDNSMVILNACGVGQQVASLGVVSGWPEAFIKCGFGGVVAPLWQVQDKHAFEFMKAAFQAFKVQGNTLGEAVRNARVSQRGSSATAYAYVCHGDVMATAAP